MSYNFVSGNEEGRFVIDEQSGVVRAEESLDREEQAEYRLMVEAVDGGKPPLSATALLMLSVGDENDNSPKFSRLFRAEIPEDAVLGSFVTQVTSSDPDSPDFANNTYLLSAGNEDQRFTIDPLSGNVHRRQAS